VVTVNGARVVTSDLRMGNVLVHVIDRALLPANNQQRNIYQILNDGGLIDGESEYLKLEPVAAHRWCPARLIFR